VTIYIKEKTNRKIFLIIILDLVKRSNQTTNTNGDKYAKELNGDKHNIKDITKAK